jgi:uncharacterized membrane protein YozB (DUF420 family)
MIAAALAKTGFILSESSLGADLSLIAEVAAVVLLTVGVVFAARRQYQKHRVFQTTGVIVSAVPAAIWMVPSLWRNTLPDLPDNLDDSAQVLTAVHSVVAVAAVVLGLVLVIRGNQLMAAGASLSGFRKAMRVAYLLYLAGAALGVAVYVAIYG